MSVLDIFKRSKVEERDFYKGEYFGFSTPTASNLTSAERNPVVASCVSRVSSTVSTLPLHVHVHTPSGVKEAWSHWMQRLFDSPNPEETPSVFFSSVARQLLVYGNCYIRLLRNSGEIIAMKIIDGKDVIVGRNANGMKTFSVDGTKLTETEVLHIVLPTNGYNGTVGIPVTQTFSDIIMLNNVIRHFIRVMFEGGYSDKYYIELDKDKFDPMDAKKFQQMYEKFIEFMQKFVAGQTDSSVNAPIIAPPATKISTISMPRNAEQQAREMLLDSNKEIYSLFHIPAEIMVDDAKGVYSTLNARTTDYINSAVRPIVDAIVQAFNRFLLGTPYFVDVDYDELTETDREKKVNNIVLLLNSGLLSINEARKALHYDAIEGGDSYILPLNKGYITDPSKDESEGDK